MNRLRKERCKQHEECVIANKLPPPSSANTYRWAHNGDHLERCLSYAVLTFIYHSVFTSLRV